MYKAKTFVNYISSDFKCQLNSTTCNSDKKWNSDTCQCQSKNFDRAEKIIVGMLAHVFVRMVSI